MAFWADEYKKRWLQVASNDPDALSRARDMISSVYSVLAEVPGEFDQQFLDDVDAYIRGDVSMGELIERTRKGLVPKVEDGGSGSLP